MLTCDSWLFRRILDENFFSFLDKEIKDRRHCVVHPVSSATPIAAHAANALPIESDAPQQLPFDFSCGFVGYVGYEVRIN